MSEGNNFPSTMKSYLEKRHLSVDLVDQLCSSWIMKFENDKILFAMKDLHSNIVWWQERFFEPILLHGKSVKSKTLAGTHVGYYFSEIDYQKPVIIVEGEIDRLSLYYLPNVIWLQGVVNLKKLVQELKDKGVHQIFILIDNDTPADFAIGKLLNMDDTFLWWVFDCRHILWESKDVNDYIVDGKILSMDMIMNTSKSLKDFKELIMKLITSNDKIDHNQFAKYIIEKLNISSVEWNIFVYGQGWDYGIWKPLSKYQFDNIIMRELESLLGGMISIFRNTDKNNIHEFVTVYAENDELREKLVSKYDSDVNLWDCVFDPKTKTIRQYSKDDYKFQKFSYPYEILSQTTKPILRLNFLDQILEWYKQKDHIVDFLQELVWSLLVTDTKYQKALLLYGSGANGKGVFLSAIRNLLGFNNCSNVGLHEINNAQNLYNLFGKLVNIDSDMQQDVQLDSWVIKKIISGEPITAKILYKQPIEYVPFARLLIATNEQPYLKTIDDSIRRRFIYLHLKNSFLGKEDFDLLDKLSEEKELIFAWAITWLCRLLERWNFEVPQELQDNLSNFIKENDTVELFLDEYEVERRPDAKIYNKDIYSLYKYFCNECGYKALSQRNFNKRLRDKGFQDFRDFQWRWFLWLGRTDPF